MLNQHQQQYLLALARYSIGAEVQKPPPAPALNEPLELIAPCFVSLYEKGGKLRGCIGTLESSDSLLNCVQHYAKCAAFQDPRFRPLELQELPNIKIGISVLGPMVPLKDFQTIEVGKHGLVVSHANRRGVLLAKVPVEFGWKQEEFIRRTCEKAHLDPNHYRDYSWQYFEEQSFEEK